MVRHASAMILPNETELYALYLLVKHTRTVHCLYFCDMQGYIYT